jgi:hypothetical protein
MSVLRNVQKRILPRKLRRADLIALVAVVVFLVLAGSKVQRIAAYQATAQGHLRSMETMIADPATVTTPAGMKSLAAELWQTEAALAGMKAELGPLLVLGPRLAWLPVIGGDLGQAGPLLDMAIALTGAGALACEGVQPAIETLAAPPPGDTSEGSLDPRLFSALEAGHTRFLEAARLLGEAEAYREALDPDSLSPGLARYVQRLDRYLPRLHAAIHMALAAPTVGPVLLGFDSPRRYLVLAQNNYETRPTGGFISAAGLLCADGGRLLDFDLRDSYVYDNPAGPQMLPPESLKRYLWGGAWELRDANWDPDFPTSAEVAAELYRLTQGVEADGVIAADLTALEYLLKATGPVQVEAFNEQVGADNLAESFKRHWAPPPGGAQDAAWWSRRKEFMAATAEALLTKLRKGLDMAESARVLEAFYRCLREKHLLVYVRDPGAAQILAENGWNGALAPVNGDYLLAVDTNVGFNKVDPSVGRSITYQVTLGADRVVHSQVTITYENRSAGEENRCIQKTAYPATYDEMMQGCYWDYLRVYAPVESRLYQGTEWALPEGSFLARAGGNQERTMSSALEPPVGDKAVFSRFFALPPGQQLAVSFAYTSSQSIDEAEGALRYRLLAQKQSGTGAVPFRLQIELPDGARLIRAQPGPGLVEGNKLIYQVELDADQRFEVLYHIKG